MNWRGAPYAFVVPASQRDPLATFELLDVLRTGAVEIEEATAPFTAGGKQLRRRVVRDSPRAAVRRVRQDDAREAGLPGSAAVSRRPAEAAVRRHRSHARLSARRRGRSGGGPVRGEADAGDGPRAATVAVARRAPLGLRLRTGIECRLRRRRAAAGGERPRVPHRRRQDRGRPRLCARHVDRAGRRRRAPRARGGLEGDRPGRERTRRAAGGRGIPPQAGHADRPLARPEQHAGRMAQMDARAVRRQSPGRVVHRLQRRAVVQVRRHRAAGRHLAPDDRLRPGSVALRQDVRVGVRRRRGRLEEAGAVGPRRRHARRDGRLGRDRAGAARSADRQGAARERAVRADEGDSQPRRTGAAPRPT